MKNNQLERYATAAFVIGSIIGTFFFSRPKRGAFRTDIADEQQRELDLNLTTPANATFGIAWPVIYTGTIGLAVHQALPSQANNPRYAKARPWLWANYVLNLVFGYFFSKSDLSSRVGGGLTTISLLPLSLGLHRQLEIGRTAVPEPENTLRKSISLYTGWLTAATVVSGANLLLQAGYRVSPATARRWAFGILSATGGLGIVVSKQLNDPYYLVTLIAAFAGIAAKQRGRNDDVAAVAAAWAVALAGVFVQRLRDAQTTAQQAPATDAADQSSESPVEPATPALVEADKG